MKYMKQLICRLANTLMITLLLSLMVVQAHAQKNTVTGTVTDESGFEMPGVSITIQGTSTGVVSDRDGNFSIQADASSVLVFSFIGYQTQEIVVGNRSHINVRLVDAISSLDEVVVIGYGSTTKKEITGAVSSIKEKDFNGGNFTSPMGLIQGKIAGMTISQPDGADPNGNFEILLRGVNTLTGGQGPLIIIDGVVGADLKSINFKDVESVDVLKDGSAAAIYGTRGTNGVVIITTKQARIGAPRVEYDAQVSIQVAPRMVENLSADEFVKAIETYAPGKASSSLFGAKTDWFDEITRDVPISTQHNLALSGGTDKLSHRTSFTYSDNQGLLKDNQSTRYVLRTIIDQKLLNDRLKLNWNINNSVRELSPANYDLFHQAFIQNPTQPVYDPTNTYAGGYSQKAGLEYYNPVAMLKERTRNSTTNTLTANLRATLQVTDNIEWVNYISVNRENWESNSYKTQYYPSALGRGGEAEISNGRDNRNQFESMVNYQKSFDKHNLQLLAGYSFQDDISSSSYMSNASFDSDVFKYYNIGSGSYLLDGKADMSSGKSESRIISVFGRALYNFDEKYLFSVSLRRDGSTKFGENKKWGYFPAVSAGYRISQEDFIKKFDFIDELKLRVGYGITGNQDFSPYKSLILLNREGRFFYNNSWINAYGPASNNNPNLQWEEKVEFNAGVDFSLLNGKISGALDYYIRDGRKLLYEYTVSAPPYLSTSLWANAASIRNSGIELTLNALTMQKSNFTWNTTFTVSHNRNQLLKIKSDEVQTTYMPTGWISGSIAAYAQRIHEGKSLGTFYGPRYLRTNEYGGDEFNNANPAGQVNESDWERIGNAYPLAVMGLTNSFTYKKWTLSVLMRSNVGSKVLNSYRMYYENWSGIGLKNIVKSQLTDHASFEGNATYSSKYLERGDFLKVDNISLGYTFDLKQNNYISKLSAYLSAQNVWLLTGYQGLDPEVSLSGLSPGIESRSYYPRTTSITLGINATF
jgi:TonB-linked SusC/RagA family outer membrane protein